MEAEKEIECEYSNGLKLLNVDVIILLINERFSTLNKRIIDSRMINSSFY